MPSSVGSVSDFHSHGKPAALPEQENFCGEKRAETALQFSCATQDCAQQLPTFKLLDDHTKICHSYDLEPDPMIWMRSRGHRHYGPGYHTATQLPAECIQAPIHPITDISSTTEEVSKFDLSAVQNWNEQFLISSTLPSFKEYDTWNYAYRDDWTATESAVYELLILEPLPCEDLFQFPYPADDTFTPSQQRIRSSRDQKYLLILSQVRDRMFHRYQLNIFLSPEPTTRPKVPLSSTLLSTQPSSRLDNLVKIMSYSPPFTANNISTPKDPAPVQCLAPQASTAPFYPCSTTLKTSNYKPRNLHPTTKQQGPFQSHLTS